MLSSHLYLRVVEPKFCMCDLFLPWMLQVLSIDLIESVIAEITCQFFLKIELLAFYEGSYTLCAEIMWVPLFILYCVFKPRNSQQRTKTVYITESCCFCFQCELASRAVSFRYFVLKFDMKADFCKRSFFDQCSIVGLPQVSLLLFVDNMYPQGKYTFNGKKWEWAT
jgi:hypothetical protein